MTPGAPGRFLVRLPQRLGDAVGAAELEAATRPPDGFDRRVEPDRMRIGVRWFPSPIPRIVLDPSTPMPAADLWAAWGVEEPADPWSVGRWDVRLQLDGDGGVRQIEVSVRPVRLSLVDPVDPDARALIDAMSAFYPHWRGGWDVAPAATFVVVHADDRPVAGAAIVNHPGGTASASCLCVDPDRLAGAAGSTLLDALEAVALDQGCQRLRLDGTVFLHREHIPYSRHRFVVAPPYDGDADASVWAEKDLAASSRNER